MKKSLLILVLNAVFAFVYSQPLVNNSLPAIGSTYNLNSVSAAIVHPNGGANTNWNFNPLSNSTLLTYSVIPAGNLSPTDISTFPAANYYTQSFLSGNPLSITFFEMGSQYYQNWGSTASGGGYNIFTVSQLVYEVNQSYGNTASKTFQSQGGSTLTRLVKYDGYGNLTLPTGSFSNVIRMRVTETGSGASSDSLFVYYATTPVMHPLLQYVVTSGGNVQNKFLYQYTNLITGLSQQSTFNTQIFPNPATNQISIVSDNKLITNVELFNATGQRVYQATINDLRHQLDVFHLPSGFYFLHVSTQGDKKVSKIVIEQQ